MNEQVKTARYRLAKAHVLPWVEKFCQSCGQLLDEVLNVSVRRPSVVRVRHHVWMLVLGSLGLGYAETAYLFAVDHTSVMSAEKRRSKLASYEVRL